jgi:hypothetical protein
VKRAHERRGATVRGNFTRVSMDVLDVVSADGDPADAVVDRDERMVLLEFVSTLSPREREVFACKYGSGVKELGRNTLSRALGLKIGEVRKAERGIAMKLERFITLVAAGALCSFRGPALDSLASETARRAVTAALAEWHVLGFEGLLGPLGSALAADAVTVWASRHGDLRALATWEPSDMPASESTANASDVVVTASRLGLAVVGCAGGVDPRVQPLTPAQACAGSSPSRYSRSRASSLSSNCDPQAGSRSATR